MTQYNLSTSDAGPNSEHDAPVDSRTNRRRTVVSSALGTTIEWYDFLLYGFLAPVVFNQLFFPTFDPVVGTIIVFSTLAVGYGARPIGGIVLATSATKLVGRRYSW